MDMAEDMKSRLYKLVSLDCGIIKVLISTMVITRQAITKSQETKALTEKPK